MASRQTIAAITPAPYVQRAENDCAVRAHRLDIADRGAGEAQPDQRDAYAPHNGREQFVDKPLAAQPHDQRQDKINRAGRDYAAHCRCDLLLLRRAEVAVADNAQDRRNKGE